MRHFHFFLTQHIVLPILLFSASCLAWGYHHPAAIRLPTEKPTTTTTTTSRPTSTTASTEVPISSTTVETTPSEAVSISTTYTPSTTEESTQSPTTTERVTSTVPTLASSTTQASTPSTTTTTVAPTEAATVTVTTTAASTTTDEPSTIPTTVTTEAPTTTPTTTEAVSTTAFSQEVSSTTIKAENEVISSSTTTAIPTTSTYSSTQMPLTQVPEEEALTSTSASQAQPPMTVVSAFARPSSNTSTKLCVRNESEISYWDFGYCTENCTSSEDCNTKESEKCICDGPCGMSCLTPDLVSIYCDAPGAVENGKALLVGDLGLYDYRNQLQRFMHNQKVIFECDEGFTLIDGPQEKICRNGLWFPAVDQPKCVFSDTPGFRWMQANRVKRRAIKSGGSSLARSRVGGGGGGRGDGGGRRGKKKGAGAGEEGEEVEPGYRDESALCILLDQDYDKNIQVELITKGADPNNTAVSEGAVVRVACAHGFGVNLQNDTIICDDKGRWRPKAPMCNALPCKVPFIAHGTFYVGGKALFFLEVKANEMTIELRCSKGYVLSGPNRFHCWFGEWDLVDSPECLPAPCEIPQVERVKYSSRYRAGMPVGHGTEVDYHCTEDSQKMAPGGPAKCHLGDWRPNKPACFHSSYISGMKNFTHDKDNKLITSVKRSCGVPQKEKGAIFYVEGKPIDYDTDFMFPDGTEVMYRCAAAKPKIKNRWKMVCDDGQWIGALQNFTCEMNTTYSANMTSIKDTIRMINSSCVYKKKETHVITFFNDQQLTMDTTEFSPGSILINRCIDIGKFKLKGAMRRKCVSGQWLGITPKCEGLSQYYDYVVDKPPTILFRYLNGSIVQTNDGKLMVYPGTTLHMECLYIRRFGRPTWNVTHATPKEREYSEGWTDGIENRDPTLEYRLTIENASDADTGSFSCITPSRHGHQIDIIVQQVDCPPLPDRPDLVYSTDSTMLGSRVTFQCRDGNFLIGAKDIICQATGSWSAPLPKCENVECPDISIVPAMAPLDYSSISRNGSLKRNETAPPKITISEREVGGKATFSCAQGYMVEGATEAVCQSTGEWSAPIPVCKEVECPAPPSPQNGHVTGNAPYKAGDLAQFECRPGFMMEGQPIIACQDNGKWSRASSTTTCVKACTYPGTTIGGTISAVKFYYPIGETVEFDCTEGYELQGSRMLHCLESAKWSTSIPSCIQKDESNDEAMRKHK